MTVKEIIAWYLNAHGYDGLCTKDCGCHVEDLMLCDSNPDNCTPAYRWECRKCNKKDCDGREIHAGSGCYKEEKNENV